MRDCRGTGLFFPLPALAQESGGKWLEFTTMRPKTAVARSHQRDLSCLVLVMLQLQPPALLTVGVTAWWVQREVGDRKDSESVRNSPCPQGAQCSRAERGNKTVTVQHTDPAV